MAGGVLDVPPYTFTKGGPTCAAVIASEEPFKHETPLAIAAQGYKVTWRCECGNVYKSLWSVMVHLNNAHEWPWDRFANKFRDALAQGMTK